MKREEKRNPVSLFCRICKKLHDFFKGVAKVIKKIG